MEQIQLLETGHELVGVVPVPEQPLPVAVLAALSLQDSMLAQPEPMD
jgi:hypothetical protein